MYLLRELSVLKMLNHPNLLTYFGAYNEEETEEENLSALYIVTELCQAGDLLNVILNKDIKMDWKIRLNIARQIASALAFLHDRNLIHRDIKSSVRRSTSFVCLELKSFLL